ncbi:metalloprotease TldD [Candidatus Tachikawaea gelatinosa]|uniref:Protease TldD n=1 Tax=Candidatus Tachikawaea gelatinosa TaxID=1410383 RepID=A0A090AJQ9_9ENTR|nr:metalloprotease TldD [Candidatus Tachikawaea gelatinosa]BAP58688.1 protease TldD [Candidatus Tachikawaea gelatinosa]
MTKNIINQDLLIENNLNKSDIFSLLDQFSVKNIDYGDLFFQSNTSENWILEDTIIKDVSYNIDQGVGVRGIAGDKTGFSYTNKIDYDSISESIKTARNITFEKNSQKIKKNFQHSCLNFGKNLNPLTSIKNKEKIDFLKRINHIARMTDKRVKKVNIQLNGQYEKIIIAATDGTFKSDIRPFIRLSIGVLVEQNGKYESGFSGGGARNDYNFFIKNKKNGLNLAEFWTKEAVRIALINLSAVSAPAGLFPVVLGPGWPGVLLHEAIGHGLEGDFNRKKTSIFHKKIGEVVASEICTIVDDGTLHGKSGSILIDDEGTLGKYNILIKNGILKKYMQDKINAKLMNTKPTGNGRRESYNCLPMPRMTSTYMLPGNFLPNEIIESIDYGLYIANLSGGQVDITTGNFVFSTSEAYLIKKGKINTPIKGATIISSAIETMKKISMIGNDLKLDDGMGMCSKDGQNIPVNVGQPTLKVDEMIIGGTKVATNI